MTDGKTGVRLRVLAVLCVFMFAALGTRLWFVQILASEQYRAQARNNGTRVVPVAAPRGYILDRDGELLVGNRGSLVVTVNRQEVGDRTEEVLFNLARVLGMELGELVELYESVRYYQFTPIPVAFDVPDNVAYYIAEHPKEFPGVYVRQLTVRTYPERRLAAHVVGYTGQISEDQLKDPRFAGDDPEDIVGRYGVEETYEQFLQGLEGLIKYRLDSRGRNLGVIGSKPPTPGHSLVLTIDADIQHLVERSLKLGLKAARTEGELPAVAAAAVVVDPADGGILAITSKPDFDPSIFIRGLTTKEFAELNDPKRRQPLFNRAIQASYPPGSTFKPFIALSALRRGLTTQERYWECPPWYQVPGTDDEANRKNNWTSADLGSMRLSKALVVSCDTVFYQLGYDYYRQYRDRNQPTLLQQDLAAFGFGHNTGVDVPSESSGIIPDPEWKDVFYAEQASEDSDGDGYLDDWANNWLPGDLLNMSIGQGDVTVTPLQLATGFSALANGGTVWRPHLALRIQAADGTVVREIEPQSNGRLPFSKKDLEYVRESLRGVVGPEGTAYYAYRNFPLDLVPVAAKTGTAEVPPFEDYSWFAAMAPADHPKYVVVVMVEQGGHGSQTAAPITRRILEGLFDLPLSDIHIHRASD